MRLALKCRILSSVNKVTIKKADDQRLVWGEVYAPDRPDVHGEFMSAADIQEMAYDFMRRMMQQEVDVQHSHRAVPNVVVVESFIAREGDPDFIPGSWVVCCHVDDDATWEKVKSGELNGFSVEALVYKEDQEVELEIPNPLTGSTQESHGHAHKFEVKFDDQGSLMGGTTDLVRGHVHAIRDGTITEESSGHRHRFSSVDGITLASGV